MKPKPKETITAELFIKVWCEVPLKSTNLGDAVTEASEFVKKNPSEILSLSEEFIDYTTHLVGVRDLDRVTL